MVRHDDEWWMNHRNTYGRLTYLKDAERYATLEERGDHAADAGASGPSGGTASDASPDAVRPGADTRNWRSRCRGPFRCRCRGPTDPAGAGNGGGGCGVEGHQGTETRGRGDVLDYMQRPLYNLGIKKKKEKSGTKSGTGSVRISARISNGNALAPSSPTRSRRRPARSNARVAGAPHRPGLSSRGGNRKMRERGDRLYANDGSRLTSFGDGPAICLIGNKSTQGTPHNAAHGGTAKSSPGLPTTVGCFPR